MPALDSCGFLFSNNAIFRNFTFISWVLDVFGGQTKFSGKTFDVFALFGYSMEFWKEVFFLWFAVEFRGGSTDFLLKFGKLPFPYDIVI